MSRVVGRSLRNRYGKTERKSGKHKLAAETSARRTAHREARNLKVEPGIVCTLERCNKGKYEFVGGALLPLIQGGIELRESRASRLKRF